MTAVNLTVDVQCNINYQSVEKSVLHIDVNNNAVADIAYRLYINDIMIIERQWIWGNINFIKENILIDIPTKLNHKIIIEPLIKHNMQAVFTLNNLNIINQPFTYEQINDLTISFKLQ